MSDWRRDNWDALCRTTAKDHPDHWASVFLACAVNHLDAALRMVGVTPEDHVDETTVPDENRANLQEVFCAWKNTKKMIEHIGREDRK